MQHQLRRALDIGLRSLVRQRPRKRLDSWVRRIRSLEGSARHVTACDVMTSACDRIAAVGLIRRIFGIAEKAGDSIACPYCERALGIEHDDAECRRKQSRRFFLGALGGAAAVAVFSPSALLPEQGLPLAIVRGFDQRGNHFLTRQEITEACLEALERNFVTTNHVWPDLEAKFRESDRIDDSIKIRKPSRYIVTA